ncbi:MAG TPA: DNA repair exonuclease [Pirellulaceae bacterium]|nr:DNA repair exonuclease [Pirellulaceae bacterium]
MSGLVRFLHASDFHLEAAPHGLVELPAALKDALLEAPYQAAQRVFDSAIAEHVDFVILSGDLLDVHLAGPRGIAFLVEQFERLEGQGIATYWAAGKVDEPAEWPAAVKLPASVQVFPTFKTEEVSHFRGEKALANLIGRSFAGTTTIQAADFGGDSGGLASIGITYGRADVERLAARPIDYWALGSRHDRQSLSVRRLGGEDAAEWHAAGLIHYPGSPQGRGLDESGPHGCTLVHISDERTVRTQFLATDLVRWHDEHLTIEKEEARGDVKRRVAERMKLLVSQSQNRPLLVQWTLHGGERLGTPYQKRQWCGDLLDWLRSEFGREEPPAWPLAVRMDDASMLPRGWEDEDSMLGDFLRVVHEQQSANAEPLDVSGYLPESMAETDRLKLAEWMSAETRSDVLSEAAALGAQLLGAEEGLFEKDDRRQETGDRRQEAGDRKQLSRLAV